MPKRPKCHGRAYRSKQDLFYTQFKALILISHYKLEYCLLKVKYHQNLGLNGPKLVQRGQNCIEKPEETNRATFLLSLRLWVGILYKKYEYCIYNTKFGPKFGLIGPKLREKAKILFKGLNCQVKPPFK